MAQSVASRGHLKFRASLLNISVVELRSCDHGMARGVLLSLNDNPTKSTPSEAALLCYTHRHTMLQTMRSAIIPHMSHKCRPVIMSLQGHYYTSVSRHLRGGDSCKSKEAKGEDAAEGSNGTTSENNINSEDPIANNTNKFSTATRDIPEPNSSDESKASEGASNITVKENSPNAIIRAKRQPLVLVEEVPLPVPVMSDIELLMTAWCEEHAQQARVISLLLQGLVMICFTIITFVFYRTMISSERKLRGTEHVPNNIKVGNVVYFDMSENGREAGRIVIGLLTEKAPLYCEYFHRRCTGSGGSGESFRGLTLTSLLPRHVCIFGEGREMKHDLEGFNPSYLPTEHLVSGPWRGAISSIAYAHNKESPNFAIHLSSGDYGPQVFGIVLAGYDLIEKMNRGGVSHKAVPKTPMTVVDCGELCTLDKSHITPMPWKLYESISKGYDEVRFGTRSDWSNMVPSSDGIFGMSYDQFIDKAAS
eukprot:Tbor_TRINITY_DN4497_c1_g2::TRINITY_DN4497_c1_g2_i1::g.8086::m.8086